MSVMTRIGEKAAPLARPRILGYFYAAVGLVMFLFFSRDTKMGELATLGLNTTRSLEVVQLPDIVVPVLPSVWLLSLVVLLLGIYQAVRGFRKTGW